MWNRRVVKVLGLVVIDILIVISSYFLGMNSIENISIDSVLIYVFLIIIGVKILTYALLKLYSILLDHVGAIEFIRIVIAVVGTNIVLYIIFIIVPIADFDWYLFFYSSPLEILLITTVRFYKRIKRRFLSTLYVSNRDKYISTLIVGAGSAGKLAYDEISKNDRLHNKVIAFVDDDFNKTYKRLNGIPILGPINNIAEYIDKYQIEEVIIAISNIDKLRLSQIIELISIRSVKIKRLPLMLEETIDDNRKILDVKIEDLLNRVVISLDNKGLNSLVNSKTVLVTGGGGSIGSELCEQILTYNPKNLILFDIYENTTYETQINLIKRIHQEHRNVKLIVLIGSVYNKNRLKDVFERFHPQLVFHAAAYKHVPLMEDSAVEAVRTNIIGTYNVASLANEYQVEKMILVSSDKAVRPTNVMGATKASCEHIIQYFDTISTTHYAAVRFGNVLGSHGSVVPLFKKQIDDGGPITLTHPDITRFFMTIPEAVSLILQSAVYAKGGEIFILDMGQPVKISDLADKMIRLSGLVPNRDIQIEYIGLRPGEKLFEELLLDVTKNIKTSNDKIYIEKKRKVLDIDSFIKLFEEKVDNVDNEEIKEIVKSLVTTYKIDKNHIL